MTINSKRLLLLFTILAAGYIFASVILYFYQEKLLFLDEPLSENYDYKFDHNFEEIFLETPQDGKINILHFTVENPKGLIIYFHGNAGNLSRWGLIGVNMLPLGYDIALMDYRGFGKSTGRRTQETMLLDAEAFYNHFTKTYPAEKIILYGRSMGTGLAAWVASRNPSKNLILETPYYNLTSLVQTKVPVFPAGPALRFKFRTHQYVKNVKCPIYIFHGTMDSVVPFRQGKKLYESIKKDQARFIVIDGGEHNNLDSFDQYWEEIEKVLQ